MVQFPAEGCDSPVCAPCKPGVLDLSHFAVDQGNQLFEPFHSSSSLRVRDRNQFGERGILGLCNFPFTQKRYKKDKEINERKATILLNNELKEVNWEDVRVGDIIFIKNNERICADFVLLYTSEEHSLCFIETANLDGESNLKTKYACS